MMRPVHAESEGGGAPASPPPPPTTDVVGRARGTPQESTGVGPSGGELIDGDDDALTSSVGSSSSRPHSSAAGGSYAAAAAAPPPSLREACHELESMRLQLRKASLSSSAGERAQRRASFGGAIARRASLGGGGGTMVSPPPPPAPLSYPSPTRKAFPAECLAIVRLLKGNQQCFDCGARFSSSAGVGVSGADEEIWKSQSGEELMYASVTYGTLLCRQCAFRHNARSAEVSLVKSLDDGGWGLHEVFHLLEGGNGNMMEFVLGKQASRRRSSASMAAERKGTFLGGLGILTDDDYDHSFDERYLHKSKPVNSWRKRLEKRVAAIVHLTAKKADSPFHGGIPAAVVPMDTSRERFGNDGAGSDQNVASYTSEQEPEPPRRSIDERSLRQPGSSFPASAYSEQPRLDRQNHRDYDPNASGQFSTPESDMRENISAWGSSWSSLPAGDAGGRDYNPMAQGYDDDANTFLTVQEKIRRKREQLRAGSARVSASRSSRTTRETQQQLHSTAVSSQPTYDSPGYYDQSNEYAGGTVLEDWGGANGQHFEAQTSEGYYQEQHDDYYEQPLGHSYYAQQQQQQQQHRPELPAQKSWLQSFTSSFVTAQDR